MAYPRIVAVGVLLLAVRMVMEAALHYPGVHSLGILEEGLKNVTFYGGMLFGASGMALRNPGP